MRTLILIGFMGAGKTTVGRALAGQSGTSLTDTDQLIEEMAGMSIVNIFAEKGEAEFRRIETAVLEQLIAADHAAVVSTGGGLPLREENRRLLKKLGTVVYLEVEPETVLKRLEGDTTRPLLQGSNVKEKVEHLLLERGPIYRSAADITVKADGLRVEDIIKELEERMGGSL